MLSLCVSFAFSFFLLLFICIAFGLLLCLGRGCVSVVTRGVQTNVAYALDTFGTLVVCVICVVCKGPLNALLGAIPASITYGANVFSPVGSVW